MLARLPDATRAEYGSPEKLIALFLAKDAAAATGIQILGQRDLSADVVGVRVRVGNDEGKAKEQNFGFRRTSDGLRLIINDPVVKNTPDSCRAESSSPTVVPGRDVSGPRRLAARRQVIEHEDPAKAAAQVVVRLVPGAARYTNLP